MTPAAFLDLLPDLLRSTTTNVMVLLLLMTLAQPRYRTWVMALPVAAVILICPVLEISLYLRRDYTRVAQLNLALIVVICVAMRPLFRDTFRQWLFSFITMANAFVAIIVLSYLLSRPLPWPAYAHTALRVVLFAGLITLFRRHIQPLYREAASKRSPFLLTILLLFVNLIYLLLSDGNIEAALDREPLTLLLQVCLMVATYLTIFLALRTMGREFALKERHLQDQARSERLRHQLGAMQDRLQLIDAAERKNRIAAHDRRHLDKTLLQLLRHHEIGEAIARLEQMVDAPAATAIRYCENPTVNATVATYAAAAREEGIAFKSSLDIPDELPADALELALVIGNLLENAINACRLLPPETERYIHFTCRSASQLVLEIENPYAGALTLDSQGYPAALESGHGIGFRSVLDFAERTGAQIRCSTESGLFRIRALI